MLQVVLIRPGCTDYDTQQRIQGSLDIPLNEQGANQVAQTAAALRDKGMETMYAPVSQPPCKRPKCWPSPRRSSSKKSIGCRI